MKKQAFRIGDLVSFGTVEDKEIEWKILTIDSEKALITSCYGVSLQAFNDRPSPAAWKTCSLREWLNNDFLCSSFTEKEREHIHPIVCTDEKNGISFSEDRTADRVFILSEEETERYFSKQSDRALLYNESLSGPGLSEMAL